MRALLGRAVIVLAVLHPSASARADDAHYQDFIVGGRAIGLGGAFTSLSDDPSGVYYNPAGLADVTKSSVQVSTSLYGFERGSLGQQILPVPGLENLDVQFTELIIVPASAGYVKALGPPGPDGKAIHAYALNIVVPSFRSFNAGSDSTEPNTDALVDLGSSYSRRVTDRSLWTGLGYGRKISERLRVGVSGFYILRSMVDIEDVSLSATIADNDEDASNDQQVFRTARNDISFINGNLLIMAGAKYLLSDSISLGASIQSPSLRLHSQSNLRFSTGDSIPACDRLGLDPQSTAACQAEPLTAAPNSTFISESVDGGSDTRTGASVRVGASYSKKYRWTLSADVTHHFAVDYTLIESEALTEELKARLPFNPLVERERVTNLNFGGEYLIVREVSVTAGFYTDFSSSPRIGKSPAQDQQPRVDMRGLTMALGYFGEHSLSRLGVLYTWGDGQDVIPTSNVNRILEREQTFQRVDYFQSFFYIFLSSTFRY